jgi:hypothetical protein
LFQPPPTARQVEAAPSRRETAKLPGVVAVDEITPPGATLDWRLGSNKAAAARIWLAADDRELLVRHLAEAATWLSARFTFTDSQGRKVSDMSWIDKLKESARG